MGDISSLNLIVTFSCGNKKKLPCTHAIYLGLIWTYISPQNPWILQAGECGKENQGNRLNEIFTLVQFSKESRPRAIAIKPQ